MGSKYISAYFKKNTDIRDLLKEVYKEYGDTYWPTSVAKEYGGALPGGVVRQLVSIGALEKERFAPDAIAAGALRGKWTSRRYKLGAEAIPYLASALDARFGSGGATCPATG